MPASPLPEASRAAGSAILDLERFYRVHARIYDWTRPFFLFGGRAAARSLDPGPGDLVLDVGCGTGFNLPVLAETGARVVGVECAAPMRERAEARLAALPSEARERVSLDFRPYGTHAEHAGRAAGILFSYSLSMIPPYEGVLARAKADLRPGGRLAVVDFLDAIPPFANGLNGCHVGLGGGRLAELKRLFPVNRLSVRSVLLWRYFLFLSEGRAVSRVNGKRRLRGYSEPWRGGTMRRRRTRM